MRDEITPHFEAIAGKYFRDPCAARNDFIDLLLNPSTETEKDFFANHQSKRLSPATRSQALELLRMQRHMMLMYSSCGWFFDDISGVEATMLLQHAGWVIKQARDFLSIDLLDGFLERIRFARSNDIEEGDGAAIFQRANPSF